MDLLLVMVVVVVVVLLITQPFRRHQPPPPASQTAERDELEAAKEAKFREIRDAELDYRTGKLSRDDWRAQDSALRAEAVELLRRLDDLDAQPSERPSA